MENKMLESGPRQNKHVIVTNAIKDLEKCIRRLEDLKAEIIGEPIVGSPEDATTPQPIVSLSAFLSEAPDIINKLTERIEGATCSIQEEIL